MGYKMRPNFNLFILFNIFIGKTHYNTTVTEIQFTFFPLFFILNMHMHAATYTHINNQNTHKKKQKTDRNIEENN